MEQYKQRVKDDMKEARMYALEARIAYSETFWERHYVVILIGIFFLVWIIWLFAMVEISSQNHENLLFCNEQGYPKYSLIDGDYIYCSNNIETKKFNMWSYKVLRND